MRRGDWYVIAGYPLTLVAVLVAVVVLVGCATRGVEIPREVRVAVPTPCLAPEDKPARPALLTDAEILGLDTYRATWALWGERLELLGYSARLEVVVEGCSRIPAVSR